MKVKKIKRSIFAILMIVLLLLGAIPIGASAAETTSDFKYNVLEDGTIELISYTGNKLEVVIPESIDGKTVSSIGLYTFFHKKQIEKIYISSSINKMYITNEENRIFSGNYNLKEIVVNENNKVYSSYDGVLYNKFKTRLIYFPQNSNMKEFSVPNDVQEINSGAFNGNVSLEKINFPNYCLHYIGMNAFSNMQSLNHAQYPYFINSGETALFTDCLNHIEIIIPKKVISMNDMDFAESDVTLYVYDNSYGLEWAKSHDFPYVIIEESPVEKDIVDEETGIQVNGLMDSDAVLIVESVENTVENAVSTFNITLKKGGNIIQPSGTITISIPSEYTGCNVFWIKDDGTKVNMNAEYINGSYVFTTDNLSVYAIVKTTPEPTDSVDIYGDVNGDGRISILDATDIQKSLVNLITFDSEQTKLSDVNGDGRVSVLDATMVQKYLVHLGNTGLVGQPVA